MYRKNTDVPDQVPEGCPIVVEAACPIHEVLDRVAGKWSIQIIVAVARGPIRYTELERWIRGISRRMLTLTLRNLERDGLIVRTIYPTVPPKVDYRLTPLAEELHESFVGLTAWADRHRADIARARNIYDHDEATADGSFRRD